MKLQITLPALDEEDAITLVIERALAARPSIEAVEGITAVEITVVSDGSTDQTVERARAFGDQIRLIVFDRNLGYGAAIQAAWRSTDAELLGFLDADGTCDPHAFAELCQRMLDADADLILGTRLHRRSLMPPLRRLGNSLLALLLSLLAGRRVSDTATGMRVLRRSLVSRLGRLPDGMHFTPAMTAHAVLRDDVKVIELEIPYRARLGASKLKVRRDGPRFVQALVEAALQHQPARAFFLGGAALSAVAALVSVRPTLDYLHQGALSEPMMLPFAISSIVLAGACSLFSTSYRRRVRGAPLLRPGSEPPVA